MLGYERIAIGPVAAVQSLIERLVKHINNTPKEQRQKARQKLAQLKIEAEVGRFLSYRLAWLYDKKMATPYDAAMLRLYNSELFKWAARVAMELLGLYGQLDRRDSQAPLQGWFEHFYLSSIAVTLAAGTSEILKNMIAIGGLKLPRE